MEQEIGYIVIVPTIMYNFTTVGSDPPNYLTIFLFFFISTFLIKPAQIQR